MLRIELYHTRPKPCKFGIGYGWAANYFFPILFTTSENVLPPREPE